MTLIGQIHQSGLDILNGYGGLNVVEFIDPKVPVSKSDIAGSDALLVRTAKVTADDLSAARNLKMVSRHGVGCDNLPVDALSARGIPVAIVGPVGAISVAEQTLSMMLSLTKRVAEYDLAVRHGGWGYSQYSQDHRARRENPAVVGIRQHRWRTRTVSWNGRDARDLYSKYRNL